MLMTVVLAGNTTHVCNHLYSLTPEGDCGHSDTTAMVWLILSAVLKSVGTIFGLAGVGYRLAKKGFITPDCKRGMGQYCKVFGTPALLLCSMAKAINAQLIGHVWFVVLIPFVHVSFGVVLGWIVSKVVPIPAGHLGTIQAAVALPNPTAVPFVLIAALQKNIIPEHVQVQLGPAGDPLVYLTVCVSSAKPCTCASVESPECAE
eukprot:COSAG05_NODE_1950_length_3794_cov_1.994317_1_plen_204_part_00